MTGCVPESNLGFQAIKKIGWKPGIGLSLLEGGFCSPIKATDNDGKHGLDFSKGRNPSQSPPPPPPSPQAGSTKNHSPP